MMTRLFHKAPRLGSGAARRRCVSFAAGLWLGVLTATVQAAFPSFAPDDVVVDRMVFHGEVPIHISGHADDLRDLLAYVGELAGVPDAPPTIHIYMVGFGDENEYYPQLLQLQRSWLKKAGHTERRLPPHSTGFHYDGTAVIQVDPRLFLVHTVDAWGRGTTILGSGFYVIAHELLHVMYDWKGIPGDQHHCLFLRENYEARLSDFLWERRMASKWYLNKVVASAEESQWNCPAHGG